MLDRRAEGASHPGGELQVDGVPDRQSLERRQHGLVLAAENDKDIVEARVADLPDGAPDERLAAKWQEELRRPILVEAPAASTTALTMAK